MRVPGRVSRALAIAVAAIPFAAQIAAEAQQGATAPASTAEYFESKVRPVLAANCYDCHTEEALGGLRLDSRDAMLKGGKRGPAIVPGDPDKQPDDPGDPADRRR